MTAAGHGEQPDAPLTGLRGRVLKGVAWNAGSQVVSQGARLVVAVILARMLAPEQYGLAAMVLVFSALVLVFSDLGFGAAIVQRKRLSEADTSTAFWTSVGAGVLFTGIGAALAGPMASFYGEPELAGLCTLFSLIFVVTSVGTIHEALLVRAMDYRHLELRVMIATLAGAAAGIVVAVNGGGARAIIVQYLVDATVSTVMLWWFSGWRPRATFSVASLRDLGGFSAPLVGHRLLYYLHRHADNILIGRFIGAAALGTYTLAYTVMLVPFSRIAGPLQRVMWPAFARLQDSPERIADAWIRATRLLAAIAVPALGGLVVVAPDFVRVVLGESWVEAIPLIQILAWVGLLQVLQSLNTDILQARGKPGTVLRFTVFFTVSHVAAFIIGLQWGVVGVAAAYAISSTLVEPVYTWMTARELGMSPLTIVRGLSGVFVAGACMCAVVFAGRVGLVDLGVSALPRLAILMWLGAAVYGACAWGVPSLREELRGLARSVPRFWSRQPAGTGAPA
jgi:O-antigen/teichoic acid export membrane protein